SYGTTVRPGEKGLANTRLSVIARRALKGFVPETRLERLDKEIEENKLQLVELEELAQGGDPSLSTALGLIYETQQVEDAALSFLTGPDRDKHVKEKNAFGDLIEIFQRAYEAPLTSDLRP